MLRNVCHYNTHSEKRFFLGPGKRDINDLIGVAGNIVSHTPGGIAAFLATLAKPYYIDPQTHAFQHPTRSLKRDVSDRKKKEPPRFEFKPSIGKLASERLRAPFDEVIANDAPITPARFAGANGVLDEGLLAEIVERVVAFQLDLLRDELDDEARELIGDDSELDPEFIVAPYFYLEPESVSAWLTINCAFFEKTRATYEDRDVYLALVMSPSLLTSAGVVDAVKQLSPHGILLWIDEHVEQELDRGGVDEYLGFLAQIKESRAELLVSHGGYLSMLAGHQELKLTTAVAHSANYGEHRAVVPVGGGIPMAHFYVPALHRRMRHGDVASIAQPNGWLDTEVDYSANLCSCKQCFDAIRAHGGSAEKAFDAFGAHNIVEFSRRDGALVRLNYPTTDAKNLAISHYLFNKHKEFADINTMALDDLLSRLDTERAKLATIVGARETAHLGTWAAGIRALR